MTDGTMPFLDALLKRGGGDAPMPLLRADLAEEPRLQRHLAQFANRDLVKAGIADALHR